MHIRFIVNPKSGTKAKVFREKKVEEFLDTSKFTYNIVETEYAGHAIELAKETVNEGVEIVAVAGGDGSVNEVAQSLMGTNTALAIIPLGSGNGVARKLKIPLKAGRAIKTLNTAKEVVVDGATFNGIPFFMTAGLGFDGYAIMDFDKNLNFRGVFGYLVAILRTAWKYKPSVYTLMIDGREIVREAYTVLLSNIGQLGYGIEFDKNAKLDDGKFEVLIMNTFSKWKVLWYIFVALFLDPSKAKPLEIISCENVSGILNKSQFLQIDGDSKHQTIFLKGEVFTKCLKIMVPQNFEL